ncbi:hypothetical protein V2J09_014719 [Rumex salicifolius]
MAAQSLCRLPSAHYTHLPGGGRKRISSFASPSICQFSPSLSQRLDNPWLFGNLLTFAPQSSNPNSLFALNRRRITASVTLSLPIGNAEKLADGKLSKWSSRAIKSFAMGELEARKLKYGNTGTEALLMGILVEGTSLTARFLRAHEITLMKVKDESIKLLGKGDFFFFSPEHPPLTEAAQRALNWAVDEKLKSDKQEEITTSDLLLGIWSEQGSPGQKILTALGFDDEKAQKLRSLSLECSPDEN